MVLSPVNRISVAALFLLVVSACVTGRAAPVERSLALTAVAYEDAYRHAVDAMNQIGQVQREDKARGLVYGQTRSGVLLDVDITNINGKATELNVKGSVPPGKVGFGFVTEPEDYLAIYQRLTRSAQR